MRVIRQGDVEEILAGREKEVIEVVRDAYRLFDEGRCAVPHSTFLRFPGDSRNRIIGLPAFVGGDRATAGMKWIASFPENVAGGLPRASAAIVLNSLENGRPQALVEGSVVSARRTAAGAALGARALTDDRPPRGITLIGCGVINAEVLRFLTAMWPGPSAVTLYDTDPARAEAFADRCAALAPDAKVGVASDRDDALAAGDLVSIATTAGEPHMDLRACAPGTAVLHLSLRDLTVETILCGLNVVDDADHVCRERTSLHLAEQAIGHRDFIGPSLGALIRGRAELDRDTERPRIFSPFGLGALDIALARYVLDQARARDLGVEIEDFVAAPATT
jgi:ornithine cyclodeaminase